MSARRDGANQLSQQLLGKPFDDTEPRDMARLVGMFVDRIAQWLRGSKPVDEQDKARVVEELAKVGAVMRAWAEFGRWDDRRSPYAPLTPELRQKIERACEILECSSTPSADDPDRELRAELRHRHRRQLAADLRKAIAPPNPVGVDP